MVRVKYKGKVSPCTVRLGGVLIKGWKTNEIRDVPESVVDTIIANPDFVLDKSRKKQATKQEIKKEIVKEEPVEEIQEFKEEESVEEDFSDES